MAAACAQVTGEFEFCTASDDASHVLIDGVVVVNNGGTHSLSTKCGWIQLVKYERHAFEVLFGEKAGTAGLTLTWKVYGEVAYRVDLAPLLAPIAA